jgi:hypothetical protein
MQLSQQGRIRLTFRKEFKSASFILASCPLSPRWLMLSAVVHCSHPQIPASMHILSHTSSSTQPMESRRILRLSLSGDEKGKIESQTPAPVIPLPPQKSALASHCEPSRSESQQFYARLAEF